MENENKQICSFNNSDHLANECPVLGKIIFKMISNQNHNQNHVLKLIKKRKSVGSGKKKSPNLWVWLFQWSSRFDLWTTCIHFQHFLPPAIITNISNLIYENCDISLYYLISWYYTNSVPPNHIELYLHILCIRHVKFTYKTVAKFSNLSL